MTTLFSALSAQVLQEREERIPRENRGEGSGWDQGVERSGGLKTEEWGMGTEKDSGDCVGAGQGCPNRGHSLCLSVSSSGCSSFP